MPTPRLTVDRYADEIEAQAALFRAHLQDADLATPVPTCPGWNLAQAGRAPSDARVPPQALGLRMTTDHSQYDTEIRETPWA